MVKRLILSVALIAASLSAVPGAAVAADVPCTQQQMFAGTCPTIGGEIVDGGVQLDAEVGVPGSSGAGGNPTGGPGGSYPNGAPGSESTGEPEPNGMLGRDDYDVTGPVTLSDLVNFRPAPGVDHMEPNGWMVVGLDTNFYAKADVQVQRGMLLDELATVRFAPVRYHWTYGDGAAVSTTTPGTTWRAQGLDEFAATPTSHVYRASGTYYIDLTIDFAAEYRWGSGAWTPIAGIIPVPANRLVATAGGAKTVLVEHECTLNPVGPGC